MIAYTFHLQTEYDMRDFERALALREITGVLRRANIPPYITLHVGLKLVPIIEEYGDLAAMSPYRFQAVQEMHPTQVCFFCPVEIPTELLSRLTYTQGVEGLSTVHTQRIIPTQVYVNRLPKLARNGTLMFFPQERLESIRCNKREHSYLSHPFHTYKGKYYPQLVGALLNSCGVEPGEWVLEPFVGSGTTLVECLLRGVNSVGIDRNPLARLISEVKTTALLIPYEALEEQCFQILESIEAEIAQVTDEFDQFLPENRTYLSEWFPCDALHEINACLRAIRRCNLEPARGVCLLTLSDSLREISFQDPESLRILRRKTPPPLPNLLDRMRRGVIKRLNALEVQRHILGFTKLHHPLTNVLAGDARCLQKALNKAAMEDIRFKAAITSPPYATALPYIDTDRLSLFALGLLQRGDRTELEWSMIGNREISDGQRCSLEKQLSENSHSLPGAVLEPIRTIQRGNIQANSGFRKRNMGALLYKYFADMQDTFTQVREVLDNGGYYVVVIGNSTTKVGEQVFDILTDDWLTEIAVAQGFRHIESFPMTDQAGYMRHSRNMIKAETIIVLQKPLNQM